jgi:hypothetical protein
MPLEALIIKRRLNNVLTIICNAYSFLEVIVFRYRKRIL